jgi:hypothetical protein
MQEVWEYRGRDSSGTYKFHIEFDDDGVAQTATKIRDTGAAAGKPTAAKQELRAGR